MEKRFALIGCGIFARETYVPHFVRLRGHGVRLTAVVSKSGASADAAIAALGHYDGVVMRFVDDEDSFFLRAKEVCDAVVICVPIPLLGKIVAKCLAAGLHVLSEKPVAMTSEEARSLIHVKEEKFPNLVWLVAENYRCEPAVLAAQQIL